MKHEIFYRWKSRTISNRMTQYNDQKKKDNDKQSTTWKTKD